MYAVVRDGSVQLRVEVGDIVEIERVGLTEGDNYDFDVLAISPDDGDTVFGTPTVESAKVVGEVLGEWKKKKLIVQRFKRRKSYSRKLGHRQRRTRVRITDITT
jgi:large subunit ribosomal protein L21